MQQRFGLVVPFLDTESTYRFLGVCRSAKTELGQKSELSLSVSGRAELAWVYDHESIADFVTRLEFSWEFAAVDALGCLARPLKRLRVLNIPYLQTPLCWFCRKSVVLPPTLTELSASLAFEPTDQLGTLPNLTRLSLRQSHALDFELLALVCPGLRTLTLEDIETSESCKGEIVGFDSLETLCVRDWSKRVPLTVRHLDVGLGYNSEAATPSNLAEVSETLVSLSCAFPWPEIEAWPRLESLRFYDHHAFICWRISDAPALRSFECDRCSVFAKDTSCRFPKLRTIRGGAIELARQPAAIHHLRLIWFDPGTASLAGFTNLRSLELHYNIFASKNVPQIVLMNLEELKIVHDGTKRKRGIQFLTKTTCPNLRKLTVINTPEWFSRPIPILPKLHTIVCDFFHTTLFQPQVKHLRILRANRFLPNKWVLDALADCEELESLGVPLRPGLATLIQKRHPMLVVDKTMNLDA